MELAANQVTSLEVSDTVLAYLAKQGASETPDIAFSAGLSPRDVSLAVHDLKKYDYVTTIKITDGRTGLEITRHELLPGAYQLTAVMVANKEKKEDARKFLAPNHPKLAKYRNNGKRHVKGVAGKVDLTKIPKGIPGKLYVALAKDGLDAKQLAKAASLEIQQSWNGLTALVKLGYIGFDEVKVQGCNKKVRKYHRIIDIRHPSVTSPDDVVMAKNSGKRKAKEPAPPPVEEMKPDPAAPTSLDSIKNYIDRQLEEGEIDIDAVLEKLDASDVLLAAAVKIADENKKLRELLKASL